MASTKKNSRHKADYATAYAHLKKLVEAKVPTNVEAAIDLWDNAESVVDAYIDAANSRSAEIPTRQALGESCFWLLFQAEILQDDANYQLVIELLSPELGLEMFGLLPRVISLREAALNALEVLAKRQQNDSIISQNTSYDDVPF